MKSLPDYLKPGLRLVSIGLNPSVASAAAGVYFVNPRNRFWRALRSSGLADGVGPPTGSEMRRLLDRQGIGFTDVVKRPTRGGAALRAADFRRDAPLLKQKIQACQPAVAWFHGKQAFGQYLRHGEGLSDSNFEWGPQTLTIGASRVFLTPNPSPANAVYSLQDLIDWYQRLGEFLALKV